MPWVLALGLRPCEAAGMNMPDSSLETPVNQCSSLCAFGCFARMASGMKAPNSYFETLIEWSRVALQAFVRLGFGFQPSRRKVPNRRVETQKWKPDQHCKPLCVARTFPYTMCLWPHLSRDWRISGLAGVHPTRQ